LVEVYPFTKIAWRSSEIEKQWEPMRQRIYNAVHYAEYQSVKQGYRACDVYDLHPGNFDNEIKRVVKDRLWYFPILRSRTYGGYGHRHYDTDTIDENTFIYGVVAKNWDDGAYFHDAEIIDRSKQIVHNLPERSHDVLGQLLGYPKCCRDFFTSVWLKDGCLDPMFEMALATSETVEKKERGHVKVSGDSRLNRLIRYWGFNIIPFFPHNFACEDALEFSEWWMKLMREKDAEATDACLEILSTPMRWSMMNCVTFVEHPLFIGSANGYYVPEKRIVDWFPL